MVGFGDSLAHQSLYPGRGDPEGSAPDWEPSAGRDRQAEPHRDPVLVPLSSFALL